MYWQINGQGVVSIEFFDGTRSIARGNLSTASLSSFNSQRFIINEDVSLTHFVITGEGNYRFLLDSISVFTEYQNNQIVELNRATYRLTPMENVANLEFGVEVPRLENYVTDLIGVAEQANLASEE